MQRRNIIILTCTSLASVMVLIGIFAWFSRAWVSVLLVLLVILCQILVVVYLSFYQRHEQYELDQEAFRLRERMEALEIIDLRERRAAELLLTRQREEKRLEELAAHYCQNLRNDAAFSQIGPFGSSNVQPHLHLLTTLQQSCFTTPRPEALTDPQSILQSIARKTEQRSETVFHPENALAHFKRCLILGEPGSGKTFFLKHCALKAAADEFKRSPIIPVYIELHAFVQSEQSSLLQFAARSCHTYGFPENDALPYLKKRLKEGSVLILLDALDKALLEKGPEDVRKICAHLIFSIRVLTLDYPLALILLAVRADEYQRFLPSLDFTALYLSRFSVQNHAQRAHQWPPASSPADQTQRAELLIHELHAQRCAEAGFGVHESIGRVLKFYANSDIAEKIPSLLLDERIEDEVRLQSIQILAEMRERSVTSGFLKCIANRQGNSATLLAMARALGLLIKSEQEVSEIAALLSHTEIDAPVRYALVDSLGVAGLCSAVPELLALCREERVGSLFHWHLAIALISLDEPTELTSLLSVPTTSLECVTDIDFYVTLKIGSMQSIGTLRRSSLADHFLALLPDERVAWELRVCAVSILDGLGETAILSTLLSLLTPKEKNIDSKVRAAISLLVALLGGSEILETLRKISSQYHAESLVYRSLIIARGRLGDQTATTFLLDCLKRRIALTTGVLQSADNEISSAEYLAMLFVLQQLCEFDRSDNPHHERYFDILCLLVQSPKIAREIREWALLRLPFAIRKRDEKERVEKLLCPLFNDDAVQDGAHLVLWMLNHYWPGGAEEAFL